jgi:hypothetical protein
LNNGIALLHFLGYADPGFAFFRGKTGATVNLPGILSPTLSPNSAIQRNSAQSGAIDVAQAEVAKSSVDTGQTQVLRFRAMGIEPIRPFGQRILSP